MSELTRLSRILIDEPLAPRPSLDELRLRSRRRHRRRSLTAGLLALIVVGAFSLTSVEISSNSSSHSMGSNTVPVQLASYYQAAVDVPDAVLQDVGLAASVAVPSKITPTMSTVATNGVVSYVGAEYCPYCAIQRWALLVALGKFGTFTNLDKQVLSSSSDVYPRLASWSFAGARYTSAYFTFDPTELTSSIRDPSGGYEPLDKMSKVQRLAYDKYNPQGEIPFVDVANHYVTLGASASPSVLEGLSLRTIGVEISSPKSPVAVAIDGTANYLIAALCTLVQKAAPPICSTRTTRLATKALNTGESPTSNIASAGTAPVQPPTNAPASVWKTWSAAEHQFLVAAAANYRPPNPKCTVFKISVTGRKLTKPLLGIPAGVTLWGMSLTGKCPANVTTGKGL